MVINRTLLNENNASALLSSLSSLICKFSKRKFMKAGRIVLHGKPIVIYLIKLNNNVAIKWFSLKRRNNCIFNQNPHEGKIYAKYFLMNEYIWICSIFNRVWILNLQKYDKLIYHLWKCIFKIKNISYQEYIVWLTFAFSTFQY